MVESLELWLTENNWKTRFFKRDPTLWKGDTEEIEKRLGWIDAPEKSIKFLERGVDSSLEEIAEKSDNVILIGIGGSSLGAELLSNVLGVSKKLYVLDTTIPTKVHYVLRRVTDRSYLIVASKSGKTIETLTLFKIFSQKIPANRVIGISDKGSYLDTLEKNGKISKVYHAPENVGGRFSIATYFGWLASYLLGSKVDQIKEFLNGCIGALEEFKSGQNTTPIQIALFLNKSHQEGNYFLAKGFKPFCLWIEQLVAESLGKDGKGVLPIYDYVSQDFPNVWWFKNTDNNASSTPYSSVITPYDLGYSSYNWMLGVTIFASYIDINPFNQPDVELSKAKTRELLETYSKDGKFPAVSIDTFNLGNVKGSYVSILNFSTNERFAIDIAKELSRTVPYPIAISKGPNYLHSTGQFHKGGPEGGTFIFYYSTPFTIGIPGMPYDLATLAKAQMLGDILTLKQIKSKYVCTI